MGVKVMKIIDKIKSGAIDFGRGIKIICNLFGIGNKKDKLAALSKISDALIPTYGKNVVRQQVIKAMEDDIKRALKKNNGAVDKLVAEALACPEYMHLLHRLNMDESHLRAQVVMVTNKEKRK